MIKNLVFDFGKVLVDYDFALFFRRHIPDAERCTRFTPVLYNERVQYMLDKEDRTFDEILDGMIAENSEYEHEINIFRRHYPEIVTGEVEGMRDLLARYKSRGYRLYGLTNWCSQVAHTMRQYDIFKLLDGVVISSQEHEVKPHAEIYRRLFDRYGLVPEECVFTDDRAENIEGAARVGMKGIVFHNAAQYERELADMLDS